MDTDSLDGARHLSLVTEAPEDVLDVEDPANDRYFRKLASLRARVAMLTEKLHSRKHAEMAKLLHQGKQPKEIAEKLGVTLATVYKTAKRPQVQELIRTLAQVASYIDGPNLAVRKNMLWRIAANNEHEEPNTAISALKELNKLEGAYPHAEHNPNQVINIVINQDQIPRTALDEPQVIDVHTAD